MSIKICSILMKKFTVRKWVKKIKFKVIQKKMEFEVFDGMQKVSFLSLSESISVRKSTCVIEKLLVNIFMA